MSPGGAGGYPSTSVILSRWSALAEQLQLTAPIGVQFSSIWARIWLNYLNMLFACQPAFLASCQAAPVALHGVPGGGTRATILDDYLAHAGRISQNRQFYLEGDPALLGELAPALRVLLSPEPCVRVAAEASAAFPAGRVVVADGSTPEWLLDVQPGRAQAPDQVWLPLISGWTTGPVVKTFGSPRCPPQRMV
eukprot:1507193-Amphidinium_carterae.1